MADDSTTTLMLKAIEERQEVFEQGFLTIKQQEQANTSNVDEEEKDERIDMVKASSMEQLNEYLSRELSIDLSAFY